MYTETLKQIKKLKAYEVLQAEELGDIRADGILLRHRKSGAMLALLPCSDDNKVFDITFRTPPADSTGVAHIIEHTVLCGSEKFPLKDPFVELVKGSFNTFLNAMTYPDKTTYPVASTNKADFHNLMHVYLDAVFRPNIYHEKNIFLQEGWRYQLGEDGALTINGVVYNEMKGAFSTADSILSHETMNALFPDTAYGVESGGDPLFIPDLTYEDYLDFHRRYYHPSNSQIFLYGDLDMAEALDFIDREYLSGYELQPVDSMPRLQEAFEEERTVRKTYPVNPEEAEESKSHFSYSFVTDAPFDAKEQLAFEVLDYALFSMPGAPVRQALLDAGIGSEVYGEYNNGILQPYFSVVARETEKGDAERFRTIVREKLLEQAEQGIDRASLESGISYYEFQYRESDFGATPKGLMYGLTMLDTWLYDKERAFDFLKQLPVFDELRKAAAEGYFEELIRTKLLANPHSALMILTPEPGLLEKQNQELRERLAAYKASLTEEELLEIAESNARLDAWQKEEDTPEQLAKIPVLSRSDIRREALDYSNIEEETALPGTEQKVRTVFHDAQTNGILYLELLFDVHHIPEEDLPYLSLMRAMLLNTDTENYGYLELNNAVGAQTGGIAAAFTMIEDPDDEQVYQFYLSVRGKALCQKVPKMLDLIKEICCRTKYGDPRRLREVIAQTKSRLQLSMQQAGHATALTRSRAYTNPASACSDLTGGIGFARFLKEAEEHFEERAGEIAERLAAVARQVFDGAGLLVSCTAEEDGRALLRKELYRCVPSFGSGERVPVQVRPLGLLNEAFRTPGQVQFVAMSGNFRKLKIGFEPSMLILKMILNYEYLWQNIRVQGGAYGCGGSFQKNGETGFTSYRDPHLKRTLEVYEALPEYLEHFEADERTMTKFIIGTMSALDHPLTPSGLGDVAVRNLLSGTTKEERQARRDAILSADAASIRALAPAARAVVSEPRICVIGGAAAIDRHAELFGSIENLL